MRLSFRSGGATSVWFLSSFSEEGMVDGLVDDDDHDDNDAMYQ